MFDLVFQLSKHDNPLGTNSRTNSRPNSPQVETDAKLEIDESLHFKHSESNTAAVLKAIIVWIRVHVMIRPTVNQFIG